MFGLLWDVHLRSSVEQQSAGFGSLALILHRFSELSIHNGHSSPYSQKPNGREKSQSWSEYERLAQALLRNCSSVRLQGAANYRALRALMSWKRTSKTQSCATFPRGREFTWNGMGDIIDRSCGFSPRVEL